MQWLRWYHGTASDMKFGRIARQTGQTRERVVFVWAMILENASDSDERGTFDIEPDDIADILHCDTADIEAIMSAMRTAGMLDGKLVCAWEKRQPARDDSAIRQRRKRERDAPVTRDARDSDAPVTPPDTDTEQNRTEVPPVVPHGFAEFWEAFPLHRAKGAAVKAWAKAVNRAPPAEIIAAAARYRPKDAKFTKHPATWLNQDCWTDEPDHHDEPDAFARAAFAVATGREYGMDERRGDPMGAAAHVEPDGATGRRGWGGDVAALPRPRLAG